MQGVSISAPQGPNFEDIEAEINKELEEDEKLQQIKKMHKNHKKEMKGNQTEEVDEDEERWPSPMEPLEYDSDRDSPSKPSSVVPPPPDMEDQTDEEKKYILGKIEQANRELLDQKAPDARRRRRLHFKDKLVDFVVPPLHFKKDGSNGEKDRAKDSEGEAEVLGKLSELKLSPQNDSAGSGSCGSSKARESSEGGQGVQEGKVLVEKDGKFDYVSLNEVESHLPLIANSEHSRSSPRLQEQSVSSGKIFWSSSSSRPCGGSFHHMQGAEHLHAVGRPPRPPAQPRNRPSSANHGHRGSQANGIKRRVQSATGTTCQATYTLSAQQKELLQRIQKRKERLAREVGKSWTGTISRKSPKL